ncbi:MAG: hypothetical protein ACXWU1_01565 [Allosphingosinicella sp.]
MDYRQQARTRRAFPSGRPKARSRTSLGMRVLAFLNQPITLFLLGAVLVSSIASLFTLRSECITQQRATFEQRLFAVSEFYLRSYVVLDALQDESPDIERLNHVRSSEMRHFFKDHEGQALEALARVISYYDSLLDYTPRDKPLEERRRVFHMILFAREQPSERDQLRARYVLDQWLREGQQPGAWSLRGGCGVRSLINRSLAI